MKLEATTCLSLPTVLCASSALWPWALLAIKEPCLLACLLVGYLGMGEIGYRSQPHFQHYLCQTDQPCTVQSLEAKVHSVLSHGTCILLCHSGLKLHLTVHRSLFHPKFAAYQVNALNQKQRMPLNTAAFYHGVVHGQSISYPVYLYFEVFCKLGFGKFLMRPPYCTVWLCGLCICKRASTTFRCFTLVFLRKWNFIIQVHVVLQASTVRSCFTEAGVFTFFFSFLCVHVPVCPNMYVRRRRFTCSCSRGWQGHGFSIYSHRPWCVQYWGKCASE